MTLASSVSRLDLVMQGGLHTGQITHIYGEAASGKSTLALQYVHSAYKLGFRSLIINSEGSSPLERLEQITRTPFSKLEGKVNMLAPKTFEEQGELIEDLELYVHSDTKLVVIDTLTRLYRVVLQNKKVNYAAHRELNRQMGFLKGLAKQRNLAMLVLNQVRGRFDVPEGIEPVAKNILDFWADYSIQLKIGKEDSERILVRESPEGEPSSCGLFITNSGLSIVKQPEEPVNSRSC